LWLETRLEFEVEFKEVEASDATCAAAIRKGSFKFLEEAEPVVNERKIGFMLGRGEASSRCP